jgi:hypothetical protein
MKVLGMVAGCVGSWLAVTAIAPALASEVFYGMFGPLVASASAWMVIERVDRTRPERTFGVMVAGFIVKMVFFGVYVAAVFTKPGLQAIPFVVSFTGYFLALYGLQAFWLTRMRARLAR